jgi:hypothetical protein
MTIQVELLNLDQHRSVKVVYSDDKFTVGTPGQESPHQPLTTGEKTESPAGVLLPGDKGSFWIHSNRELRVIEGNEE